MAGQLAVIERDDLGTRLKAAVGDLSTHPYGDWIATYGDPDFTAATDIPVYFADPRSPWQRPSNENRLFTDEGVVGV